MRYFFTLILLGTTFNTFSQNYLIIYEYNWVKYECRPLSVLSGSCVLSVSENYSEFYDFATKEKSKVVNSSQGYQITGSRPLFKYRIQKSKGMDSLVVAEELYAGKFMYKDIIPDFNWETHQDTMIIQGYTCQRATGSYAGRDYEAWFTIDIPISNGPDKFGGLPGLILKIEDSEKKFSYELKYFEEVEKTTDFSLRDNLYKPVTKKKFKDLEADYYINFKNYAGPAFNNNNTFTLRGRKVTVEEFFEDMKQDYYCRNNID